MAASTSNVRIAARMEMAPRSFWMKTKRRRRQYSLLTLIDPQEPANRDILTILEQTAPFADFPQASQSHRAQSTSVS